MMVIDLATISLYGRNNYNNGIRRFSEC